MSDILRQISRRSRLPHEDQIVREIAQRSIREVRERLSVKVTQMGDAELRGYVRARALRPIRQEAERLVAGNGWRTSEADALTARALERAVHLILNEMRMQPVAAPSAVHATLRAAG